VRFALLLFLCTGFAHVAAFFAPGDATLEQAATDPAAAAGLFLKFQATDNDYLVFYDADGSILFLRYRQDRWDYDNDRLRDALQQGITYQVKLKNIARLPDGELPKGANGAGIPKPVTQRKIRKIRDSFVAELVAINESALRDLRY
jgi:hypothetical protein